MEELPQIYSFTLSPELADSIVCWSLNKFNVESPSFGVLLDHTLAVIWHVFDLRGAELHSLNRADIIWALRFLESIETSQASDAADLETLMEYFRKILIAKYSMEEEKSFDTFTTMYESTDISSSSLALDDFLSSSEVMEDLRKQPIDDKTFDVTTKKCSDDEILEQLQKLNPNIRSLDDVKAMVLPSSSEIAERE